MTALPTEPLSSVPLSSAEEDFRRRYRRTEAGAATRAAAKEDLVGVTVDVQRRSSMTKARILIVEDDASLAEVLDYNLTQEGYETQVATDGQQGLREIRLRCPDMVILDLMLPMIEGLEVCRLLRADPSTSNVLVLMLTARAEESDELVGFSVGADDYVTKPFSVKVLLQRINALLRRKQQGSADRDVLVSQGVMIDRRRHRATAGDRSLDLTPSEFGLLTALLRQPGRAFTRAELIDVALGDDALVLERTIDVHIRALRKKLGAHADIVQTVRGIGYRLRDPSDALTPGNDSGDVDVDVDDA
jgi:DNA-binding response OmpR family regulator